ncbi:MAG TPA: hypothetical protein ENJ80_04285 [Gammaproteobacteria bacterium]|nr:hypothetical protein [Gammaproteobacteria bacterium]
MQIETDELVTRLFDTDTEMELIDLLMLYRETSEAHVPKHRRQVVYMQPFTPSTTDYNSQVADGWW